MPIKPVSQMVAEATALVRTLDLEEARAAHGQPGVVFVDLRDVRELEREGVIPGAVHAPRGMLEFWVDPASPYFRAEFAGADSGEKTLVLFCAAAWRSALAARQLQEMGFPKVCHVEGGFNAWKAAGAPVVEKPKRPAPPATPAAPASPASPPSGDAAAAR
jgi:rhodanese-related sulfurtransferase